MAPRVLALAALCIATSLVSVSAAPYSNACEIVYITVDDPTESSTTSLAAYTTPSPYSRSASTTTSSSAMPSETIVKGPNGYEVPGVGTFNTLLSVDFSTVSEIPEEITVSDWPLPAGDAPYSQILETQNVRLNHGDSLSLLVPGVKEVVNNTIPTAEIETTYADILYGSVRVVAQSSNIPGTCEGFFFYKDDNQETDIEILTYDLSKIWFTNQASHPGGTATDIQLSGAIDPSAGYHEYRIDWTKSMTRFYVDGVHKQTFTTNVADKPSAFIINNWSNGDPNWSKGPPTETSELKIKSITGYFNRTSV